MIMCNVEQMNFHSIFESSAPYSLQSIETQLIR